MREISVDVVVIGTGPGGEGAAMKATKSGKSVVSVERYTKVGGGCTHWGTIPSKALRHSISRMLEYNRNPLYRQSAGQYVKISFGDMLRSAESVIARQVALRSSFYARNEIQLIYGEAYFVDNHTIQIIDSKGVITHQVTAKNFVIASGSKPYRPPMIDFNETNIFDSDTILNLKTTPRSVTVYGAGVIGCEYASMFRNIGCKVDLIDTRDQLLSFLDDEIAQALSYHMRDQGVMIRHNEEFERLEVEADGVAIYLKSGKKVKNEILLWANGRTGNAAELNLDAVGLTANSRGQLVVDENYRSQIAHIYAVGDIIGYPSLASAAYDQGRFAATHIVEGHCNHHLVKYVPTGIYTLPEISSVGRTEKELTAAKVPYEVGHAYFKSLARAQITDSTVGMLKLLFHRETLAILGVHCFGNQAAEIIHIGQAILAQDGAGNTLDYFINTTFNYPTMAEAYRVAAINGMNRLG